MSLLKPTKPKLKGFLFFIFGIFLFKIIHYIINFYVARKYGPSLYGSYVSYDWIFTILSYIWIYLLICMVFSIAKKKSLFNDFKPSKQKIIIFAMFLIVGFISGVNSFLWRLYVKSHPAEALQFVGGLTGIVYLVIIHIVIYLFLVYVFVSIIYSMTKKKV